MITVDLGRWTENALRVKPRGIGKWSGVKRRAYAYHIIAAFQARPEFPWKMAELRRVPTGWVGRIEGFEWTITPDMGAARFQSIPSTQPLTHTPAKLFRTLPLAKTEIEKILAERPKESA